MKRPVLRLAVQIAVVMVLVSAAVLALGPVRYELGARLDRVKEEAIVQLESLLGRRVTYTGISPSVLRYVSINGLTVHGREGEPADLLTVEHLRVYYRPVRILQGRLSEAFSEIRVENTSLSLDTGTDRDLAALFTELSAGSRINGGDAPFPENLVISGHNLTLSIRTPFGRLRMDRVFFSTTLASDVVTVRTSGGVRLDESPDGFPIERLAGAIEASGTIHTATGEALVEVHVPELVTDIGTLRRQVLQVRYADGTVEARNVQSRDPVDIYVRYRGADQEVYARILADGYRLSELLEFSGRYAVFNDYLRLPLSGQLNATLSPDSLSFGGSLLTRLEDFPGVPDGEVTVTFSGDPDRVRIADLSFTGGLGTVLFTGDVELAPLRPSGNLTLRDVRFANLPPLSLTARVDATADRVSVSAEGFRYVGRPIHELRGSVVLSADPVADVVVRFGPGDQRVEVRSAHTSDWSLRRADIDARGIDPAGVAELIGTLAPNVALPDLSWMPASLTVDTRLSVDLERGVAVSVPLFYAFDRLHGGDHVSFSLWYDNGVVDILDITASYQGYEGSGSIAAEVGGRGAVSFDSSVVVQEVPYRFSGTLAPDRSLTVRGLYDVDGRFHFGDRGELVFRAQGDLPVPISGSTDSHLAFDVSGYFHSESDWDLTVRDLTVRSFSYAAVTDATVSVAGTASATGGRFTTVRYVDEFSALEGDGEASWSIPERRISGSLSLAAARKAESTNGPPEQYTIDASWDPGRLAAEASYTRLPLLRLGIETLRGSVSGTAAVNGPLDDPLIEVSARIVDGKFNNDPVDLAGTLRANARSIALTEASGRYVRTHIEDASAHLTLDDGAFSVSGRLTQGSDFSVGVLASGAFEEPAGYADLAYADFTASLLLSGLPFRADIPPDWEFSVARHDGVIDASGGPDDAVALILEADGYFEARVGGPLPVRFNAVGVLSGGAVEADLTAATVDVPRFWRIVSTPGFAFTRGTATGSARVVGPLNDPDYFGTLTVEGLEAQVDMIADPIGPGRTFLVFEEKLLSVRETTVPAGPGRAQVSALVTFDRWLPDEFRVFINTLPDSPVRVVNDFGDVAVSGFAGGSIEISGDLGTTRITGAVTASQMDITLSETETTEPDAGDPDDTRVDIAVTSGRAVRFLWPTDVLPILQGSADVGETVRITWLSALGEYTVRGGVDIQGGEVFYFDRSFYIRDGRITFDENQTRFDPLLSVLAEIREVADEGPVRIYLVADERALSDFTPRWRSDPPLSEASILALLGGGIFTANGRQPIGFSQALLLGTDVASQFGIIRGFESAVRNTLQLDLFSVRTQLFQNLLRGVIDTVEPPLDTGIPSLGKYLDNTTLFLGKYLGTDLFLELLVQLRASESPLDQPRSLAGVEIESEFSLAWQTPFFLLEWSFFPRDPGSLFLADNTVRFSWELSY